jgi:hypothetical protein
LQEPTARIQLQIYSDPCSPEIVVNTLASIAGPIDIYFWDEAELKYPVNVSYMVSDCKYSQKYGLKICEVQYRALFVSKFDGI